MTMKANAVSWGIALAAFGLALFPQNSAAVECTGTCATWNPEEFPDANRYSSSVERQEWLEQLQDESSTPIRFDFSPLGHLKGLAGDFPLVAPSIDAMLQWVFSHRKYLGLPDDVRLEVTGEAPFDEFDNERDRMAGTAYTITVSYLDIAVPGRELVAIVREDGDRIRGLYNGFVPAIEGYLLQGCGLAQSDAWNTAETSIGRSLTAIPDEPAKITWFEPESIHSGSPGVLASHWRLAGFDDAGMLRRVFVDCNSNTVSHATPAEYGFSLPTTHYGYELTNPTPAAPDVGAVYLDNATLPAGCAPSTSCTDPARADSHGTKPWPHFPLKDNLPAIVDFFYKTSSPVTCSAGPINQSIFVDRTNCFPWPFTAMGDGPLTNRNAPILAVAANGWKNTSAQTGLRPTGICSVACYKGAEIAFIKDRIDVDVAGHEYGHGVSNELKATLMSPPDSCDPADTPCIEAQTLYNARYNFNETMSDFYGVAVNTAVMTDRLQGMGQSTPPSPSFYVDDEGAWDCPLPGDPYGTCPAAHMNNYTDWVWQSPAHGFNCVNYPRFRMGRVFYETWEHIVSLWGPGVTQDYDDARFFWRAWFINVMRSYSLTQTDFPTFLDLKAATTARIETDPLVNTVDWLGGVLLLKMDQLYSEPYGHLCYK